MDEPTAMRAAALEAAFRRGRRRNALEEALPAAGYALLALLVAGPSYALPLGLVLFAAGAALAYVGGDASTGVGPGLRAGLLPFAFAHVASRAGHVCMAGGCTSLCMPACALGGVLGGAYVAWRLGERRSGLGGWLVATAAVAGVGLMACQCIGLGSLMGLMAGHLAGSAGLLLRPTLRAT